MKGRLYEQSQRHDHDGERRPAGRRPGRGRGRPTPHTHQNITVDADTGDSDPEIEQRSPRVRRNLEDAIEAVGSDEDNRDRQH